jgi:RHS repeat-associated protein
VHQDPVVTSKRVTDGYGNVVSVVELDPWGGETNRSSNEAFQPRKFTTYERDSIGSDEAMHRRYNRWWSRFEQPDPYEGGYDMTDPQSFNRYSYVQNDPVNFVDPSGLNRVAPSTRCEFRWAYKPHLEGGGDWVLQEDCFEQSDDGGSIRFGGFGSGIPQNPVRVPFPGVDAVTTRLNTGDCKRLHSKFARKSKRVVRWQRKRTGRERRPRSLCQD